MQVEGFVTNDIKERIYAERRRDRKPCEVSSIHGNVARPLF